jgi:hypothetical protein
MKRWFVSKFHLLQANSWNMTVNISVWVWDPHIWIQFLSEGYKNKLDVFISLSLFKTSVE